MERRQIIFLVLTCGILLLYSVLVPGRPRPAQPKGQVAAPAVAEKAEPPVAEQPPKAENPIAEARSAVAAIHAAEPEPPEQWVTLGSADPGAKNPYRMLVTLTNKGAAVARIELNQYFDIDDRSGYLGHLVVSAADDGEGCLVQVIGPGTPAAQAGLKPGDVITSVGAKSVSDPESFNAALARTRPKQTMELSVMRDGETQTFRPELRRRPLEVIKPEGDDPLSMLLSLQQFDKDRIVDEEPVAAENSGKKLDAKKSEPNADDEKESRNRAAVERELDGVKLRTGHWSIVSADQSEARFRRTLPEKGLEIIKTYRLAKAPEASAGDASYPAYHLEFDIEIRNIGGEAHKVAYRLDGPNGLPTEGKWYASKVSRNWGAAGLRDFVISLGGGTPYMIGAPTIASGKLPSPWPEMPPDKMLTFIGVDAQYFSAVLMPQHENSAESWFAELKPIRVGKVDPRHLNLTNTSCRLVGMTKELKPGQSLNNRFKLFTGPKKRSVLENSEYRLGELIYYGWPIFAWTAIPLTAILHGFYAVVQNYGLAIILLTVLVRGCMFPLSRKQVIGAQKMQQLQPEIKKLQEKYKNNAEGRTKAQQELFRKHNYNPLSGCLPIFIQMPIFIGLYRSLMVAIELRDAPLLTHSVRWCSNLAAPDMLFKWQGFWHSVGLDFVNSGVGIFGLGPYFNLLPIFTILLFIWQQKMFMPPPADEQAAMQQKVMQYMMIFMGVMFFKVASGLCIYFIASSLWGLAERRFLPKMAPATAGAVETRAQAKARERQIASKGKQ
jgi:YidC/Oxa1 family membrane protein insertase